MRPTPILVCGAIVAAFTPAPAYCFWPFSPDEFTATAGFTNHTGSAANDLHVDVTGISSASDAFSPQFNNSYIIPPASLNFDGGTVNNGGFANVSWTYLDYSAFATDAVWTADGKPIGGSNAFIAPVFSKGEGVGSVLVGIMNLLSPGSSQPAGRNPQAGAGISYSNLQIVNNANASFFTPGGYVAGMATGTPVSLLVPSSGILGPGLTMIADFNPTVSPLEYSAGSILINGDLYAKGATRVEAAVPEPGGLTLVLLGVPGVTALWWMQRRAARSLGRTGGTGGPV
jgi:hypothetical protein